MMTTILLMVVIFAVGTQATDTIRVRQEEVILRNLPLAEAHEYYELLRRRARRVQLLRALTLVALVLTIFAGRRRFFGSKARPTAAEVARRAPTNTEAARQLAALELARQGARGVVDPTQLEPRGVSGDDRFPWIFEYAPRTGGGTERVRIYVDRTGAVELHRIP